MRTLFLLLLLIPGVCRSQNLGIKNPAFTMLLRNPVQHVYTPDFGAGPYMFAPGPFNDTHYGMLYFTNNAEGLVEDSLGPLGSHYSAFGSIVTNMVIDAVMAIDRSYSTYTSSNFPFGGQHIGPAMRFVDNHNFAGMATISVTATQLQIIDRVASVEYPHLFHVPALAYGEPFRVRIENTNANDCNISLWNSSGGLLTNYSYTFQTGVPASGRAVLHTFDCAGRYISLVTSNLNGPLVSASKPFFNSLTNLQSVGVFVTNGVMTVYTEGSFGSLNTWRALAGSNTWTSFNMGGTMNRRSGRLLGVAIRQDNRGSGIWAAYDHTNTVLRLYAGTINGLNTLASSAPVTLTAGTDYRFHLSVTNATNFTFSCNGATVSFSTNGHPSGFLGFVGLQSVADYHSITVTNL